MCTEFILLIYVAPLVSLLSLLLTLLVAYVVHTYRDLTNDVQIKVACLLDDYFQAMIPRGIASRFKKDNIPIEVPAFGRTLPPRPQAVVPVKSASTMHPAASQQPSTTKPSEQPAPPPTESKPNPPV